MAIACFKPSGRMGNFLFSAFNCVSYALEHDIEFSMPSQTNNNFWNPIYFPQLINPKWIEDNIHINIKEKEYFKYDEIEWQEQWRGAQILFSGYFQNYKYFEKYREQILDIFQLRSNYNKELVSVHCRRGDYLTIKNKHIVPDKEWYEKSMNMFPGKQFVFHSDDIEWCKQNFGDRDDCIFQEKGDEVSDFKSIISCGNHINSSSTFSWMGAWLSSNPNKKVITPSQWMQPAATNQWTEEIVPKEWIRLE